MFSAMFTGLHNAYHQQISEHTFISPKGTLHPFAVISSPWRPLIHFLFSLVCQFLASGINGILDICLLFFRIQPSHNLSSLTLHFSLWLNSTSCLHFIYSPADGCWGCFWPIWITLLWTSTHRPLHGPSLPGAMARSRPVRWCFIYCAWFHLRIT